MKKDRLMMMLQCVGTLLECFGHGVLGYSDYAAVRKLVLL